MPEPALRERIADNLTRVERSIADAAAGRDITLVCVTKYAPLEHVIALVEAGGQHLGENLLPAGAEKFAALRERGLSFTAHMLGPLQSRKANLCAESCDWYQALERVETAQRLHARLTELGRSMDVLVQVDVSGEERKHGVAEDDVPALLDALAPYDTLRLRGLMCIPAGPSCFLSPQVYEATTRNSFRQLASLFDRMAARFGELPFDTLSMGMSGDYRWAIAEGATMVRVGRALFEGLDERQR